MATLWTAASLFTYIHPMTKAPAIFLNGEEPQRIQMGGSSTRTRTRWCLRSFWVSFDQLAQRGLWCDPNLKESIYISVHGRACVEVKRYTAYQEEPPSREDRRLMSVLLAFDASKHEKVVRKPLVNEIQTSPTVRAPATPEAPKHGLVISYIRTPMVDNLV